MPYELPMLQAIRGVLNEGDLVLDIGANIGNHTLYLAAVVGCRVVAFAPNLSSPHRCKRRFLSMASKSMSL